ncbi:ubiquitin carboxyl-terminal hydrolase 39 isoform X2 [Marmota flaviventris]|uniref:ubiquitin carboxyl-terminal hydrolase 39 isoform X2 n=1 Tax=Marmota flaviventris TaxID=93162 RepID=UPI000FFF9D6A|nr:U4/U6.U5 tri-snRNP-associated protein 2 isoform X2 [Marmota flaviventris]
MSSRSKRESRGSARGKRESEARSSSGRSKREREREREPEAAGSRGSPVRVKREVEPASAREAPAPTVPAPRVKREREADEDSEPEREQRMAAWILRIGGAATAHIWIPLTGVCWTLTLRNCALSPFHISMHMPVWCVASTFKALSNVPPLRNYFLEEDNYKNIKRPPGDIMFLLVQRFGELMRKLWNPRNFKAHVSPHEMLQAVVLCSRKTFQITKQGDGVDFLSWFLNALHSALGGTKKKKKTIVTDVFQGSMRIFTKKLPHPDLPAEEKEQLLHNDEYQETMVESTFMYLTLDLPTAPLYKDEKEQLIIPQVPLFNILAKFNGITEKEYKTYKENFLKRFQLTKLPPYLIFCIKRFTKNNFFVEKNPTIVNFPITNVDLREYLSEEVQAVHKNTTYDLIANIVHDGKPSEGSYRIHVLHHGTGKWYELQDLQVTDILPQMITLSEAYIQIWKRRDAGETNQQGA